MAAQAIHAAFAANEPDGICASGPSVTSAKTCSTIGVVPVLPFGLEELERGVSEHGVVAEDGEQLVLARGGLLVQVADPADDQPGGDRLPFFDANAVYRVSATCASETQARSWSSQIARGYLMAVQASPGMAAIAALTLGSIGTVTENTASARPIAAITLAA